MNQIFRILTAVIVVAVGMGGVAVADTPNGTSTPAPPPIVEEIDGQTTLVNLTYIPDGSGTGGRVIVVVESTIYQKIVVTDANGFTQAVKGQGGVEIAQTSAFVQPDGRLRLELEVTESDNWAGVTIATPDTLRGYELATGGGSSPFAATSSTAGWLGGAGVSVFVAGLAAWQRKTKDHGDVKEVE